MQGGSGSPSPNPSLSTPKSQARGGFSFCWFFLFLPAGRPLREMPRHWHNGVEGSCLHSCVAFGGGRPASAGGGREEGWDSPAPTPPPEALDYRGVSDIS